MSSGHPSPRHRRTISPVPIIAEILSLFTKKPVAYAAATWTVNVGVAACWRSSSPSPERSPVGRFGAVEGPRSSSSCWGRSAVAALRQFRGPQSLAKGVNAEVDDGIAGFAPGNP